MHTPVGKGLFNCLLKYMSRIVFVELENTDKLLHPSSFRPFLFQVSKHQVVGLRPLFAPAFDWCGVVKCAWPLLKHGKIMERIKNILFFLVASGVPCNEFCFVIDVNM